MLKFFDFLMTRRLLILILLLLLLDLNFMVKLNEYKTNIHESLESVYNT